MLINNFQYSIQLKKKLVCVPTTVGLVLISSTAFTKKVLPIELGAGLLVYKSGMQLTTNGIPDRASYCGEFWMKLTYGKNMNRIHVTVNAESCTMTATVLIVQMEFWLCLITEVKSNYMGNTGKDIFKY